MAKINDCALIYKGKTSVTIYNKSLSCAVLNGASSAWLNWEGSRTVLMSVLNCITLWFYTIKLCSENLFHNFLSTAYSDSTLTKGSLYNVHGFFSIKNSHWPKNPVAWGLTVHSTTYIAKLARSIYLLTTSHKKAFVLPLENRSSCYN